jgi:Dolichyl-phosphate-mannose-protein mannosyltransferase
MSILVLQATPPLRMFSRWAAAPPAWALLATIFLVIATLAGAGSSFWESLGDTDDAVRLISARELLAEARWFDTTLPRIGAPEPLVSHWSRLIDAALSAMIAAFAPLLGNEGAELATRILWPTALFLALALIVASEARRQAGPLAAAFVLYLVATSAIAIMQFRPGRIDHHNVQVLCAVVGLLFLARSWDDRRFGWIAGALVGFGLAIGYEAIVLIVPALAIAAVLAVWHPLNGAGVARACTAATAVLFLALALTVPPARWLDVHCDTLSLNLAVLAAITTAGLRAAMLASPNRSIRFALLGASMAVGGAVYAAFEPACLAGPYGQLNAALKPLFLDHVLETKSLFWLGASEPTTALAAVAFIFAGVVAQIVLWHTKRDVGMGLAAAFVVLASALGCWQLRLLPYAGWLAAMSLAIWAARLPGTASLSAPVIRLAVVVLLSHATLDVVLSVFRSPTKASDTPFEAAVLAQPCFRSANVRDLATLPPGLVAADIDLGPFIVALTPHRVVAAPYHRLDKGILANDAILRGTPEQAMTHLRDLGVSYVVLCADRPIRGTDNALRTRLLGGEPPQFLRELDLLQGTAIRVWKVSPAS